MEKTLANLVMILRKEFVDYCNRELQEMGISQGLLYYLLYIGKHPSCSPGLLSEQLHMDTGHTTRSIEKLVQTGFVTKERSGHDKRVIVLKLTGRGEEAFQRSYQLFYEWDKAVLKDIDEEDRKNLFRILDNIERKKEGGNFVRYY